MRDGGELLEIAERSRIQTAVVTIVLANSRNSFVCNRGRTIDVNRLCGNPITVVYSGQLKDGIAPRRPDHFKHADPPPKNARTRRRRSSQKVPRKFTESSVKDYEIRDHEIKGSNQARQVAPSTVPPMTPLATPFRPHFRTLHRILQSILHRSSFEHNIR